MKDGVKNGTCRCQGCLQIKMIENIGNRERGSSLFRSWDYLEYPNIPVFDKVNWQVTCAAPADYHLIVIVWFQQDRRENLDLNFARINFSTAYNLFSYLKSAYFGESGKQKLSISEYKDVVQLIVFDFSNSDPSVKVSTYE